MCGIGGMLGAPDTEVLHRINRLQQHRGPDGHGVWQDEHAGLAHARLAILDLDGGQQPLHGDHGAVVVVNGEIYNHLELRKERSTYRFQRRVDSEVILALHAQAVADGAASAADHAAWIRRLDGMYAFALWDPAAGEMLLARDPLGIKPLVLTEVDDGLLFASEVKGLRAHEGHVPRLDEGALALRLAWEYPLDQTTLLQDVRQVRPGTVERWGMVDGRARRLDVAHIERQRLAPASSWNPEVQAADLLESFIHGVEQRLMAEVPVGIVLSGGLDSSLVAAVAHEAAERAGQPVPEAWTVAESEDNPDWQAAENVASSLDLVHHQHLLEEGDFERHLPKLVWHGEDLDTTVMFFQPLFQTMSNQVTVGLCGQGADELHAGYPRYRDPAAHGASVAQRLRSIDHPVAEAALAGQASDLLPGLSEEHLPQHRCGRLEDLLEFELEHGQLSNFQLRLVDRHSMAHGLEVRVPFLGKAHRQAAHRLPMDWRLPSTLEEKAALRRAADLTDLPPDIVRRPKLPAGTATSPSLLKQALHEHRDAAAWVLDRHPRFARALRDQPDMMLGLALFEAIHLQGDGRRPPRGSLEDLLEGAA